MKLYICGFTFVHFSTIRRIWLWLDAHLLGIVWKRGSKKLGIWKKEKKEEEEKGKTGGRPGGRFLKYSFRRVKVAEAKLEQPYIGWKAERCMCSSIESSGGELKFCEWVGRRPERCLFDVPSCLNESCLGLLSSQVTIVFLGCPVTQKEGAKESSICRESL